MQEEKNMHDYRLKTVRQVLEYYMENHGDHVASFTDLQHMTSVFIFVMGNKKLSTLTPDHFIAYSRMRRQGKAGKRPAKTDGTIRRELQHLKAAIAYCARAKLVSPMDVPNIPMPAAPKPRERWLSKKEIQAVVKVAQESPLRGRLFVQIALRTGARKSVIENLTWDQIDFDRMMIDFGKHESRVTKKRKPVVPIHRDLLPILKAARDAAENEYVLGTNGDIRATLDAIAHRAGVKGLTPHVFRHTWATHASMNGTSLLDIARVLGNTVDVVERTYAKYQPEYLRNAIQSVSI